MIRLVVLVVFLGLFAGVPRASAWGCDGHQAVALIAERFLTRSTLSAVEAVLAASPIDPALKQFCRPVPGDPIADASTWADDYRAVDTATFGWHFINIPLAVGNRVPDYRKYCPTGNCVIAAIASQYRVLKSSTDAKLKANALRFIIHFVGDLHQPLHITTNGDRGGNCTPVTYFNEPPEEDERHAFRPNLHGVWDDSTVRRLMAARGFTQSRALAAYIADGAPRHDISAQAPTEAVVALWARESGALARTVAYGRLPVKVPVEPADALAFASCADNNHVGQRMADLHEQITDSYEQASVPVILKQIQLAGERLAAVLMAAFP